MDFLRDLRSIKQLQIYKASMLSKFEYNSFLFIKIKSISIKNDWYCPQQWLKTRCFRTNPISSIFNISRIASLKLGVYKVPCYLQPDVFKINLIVIKQITETIKTFSFPTVGYYKKWNLTITLFDFSSL